MPPREEPTQNSGVIGDQEDDPVVRPSSPVPASAQSGEQGTARSGRLEWGEIQGAGAGAREGRNKGPKKGETREEMEENG